MLCLILMNCYIFVNESDDPSISDVRKQVRCNICQEIVNHSDVEVVDCIPFDPQNLMKMNPVPMMTERN